MASPPPRARIPWSRQGQWPAAHGALIRLMDRHREHLQTARDAARRLQRQIASLIPLLDELAASTCSRCPEPCCLTATPWYDYRDLVFLHLTGLKPPPAQPVARYGATCRYLGTRGCELDRMRRPFICTWYLCPTQTARLRNAHHCRQQTIIAHELARIKTQRRALEQMFLKAIVSQPPHHEPAPGQRRKNI